MTDIALICGMVVTIGGGINRYLGRSMTREFAGFKLELFAALDEKYVSINAHDLHERNDARENESLRRTIEKLQEQVERLAERQRMVLQSR